MKIKLKVNLLEGYRFYWLFPIAILLCALFGNPSNLSFILPIFVAAVASGIALWSVDYNLLSFVSLIAIMHAIFYPLGALLDLMLPIPVIEPFLWNPTPYAMWASSLGMIGLAIGAKIISRKFSRKGENKEVQSKSPIEKIPSWINIGLSSLVIPIVIFMISKQFYFHSGITGIGAFSFENAGKYAYMDYIVLLSYAGLFFQIRRYIKTKKRIDAILAIIAFLIPLIAFIPSGSRDRIFRVVLVALPVFWHFEHRKKVKILMVLVFILMFIFLIVSVRFYRSEVFLSGAETLSEKAQTLVNQLSFSIIKDSGVMLESYRELALRFSDYVATGWFIANVPENAPFRYLDNLQNWPALLLPSFIRPELPFDVIQESGYLTLKASGYGWVNYGEGSVPTMTLGDLYLRFGWLGIFFGMILIGVIARKYDSYFSKDTIHRTILFVLIWPVAATRLVDGSLTEVFIYFTRTFFISWVLALGVAYLINIACKKNEKGN